MHGSASAPSVVGALAYDKGQDRLVYFGGTIAFAQYADTTWTWAGGANHCSLTMIGNQ